MFVGIESLLKHVQRCTCMSGVYFTILLKLIDKIHYHTLESLFYHLSNKIVYSKMIVSFFPSILQCTYVSRELVS